LLKSWSWATAALLAKIQAARRIQTLRMIVLDFVFDHGLTF